MRDHRWPGGRTEAERNREGPIRAVNGGGRPDPGGASHGQEEDSVLEVAKVTP